MEEPGGGGEGKSIMNVIGDGENRGFSVINIIRFNFNNIIITETVW